MNLKSCIAILSAGVIAASSARAASETLPELARRFAPKAVYLPQVFEIVPSEVGALVSRSELIVQGRVTLMKTYLSDDQRSLFTDYLVTPTRVILQRRPQSSDTPGVPPPILLTRWGGTMQIEGATVTQVNTHVPPLDAGQEYILFLREDESRKGTSVDVNAMTGTWEVLGGSIELPGPAEAYGATFRRFRGMAADRLPTELR